MATPELTTTKSIMIRASIEKVWTALTSPDLIKQWFFGVETETDWKVGSPLIHRGEYQGKPYEDKGTIVRFERPRLLAHTHWSELSGEPDNPEHYQEVSWELSGRDGATELTITERNLASAELKAVSEKTWPVVLNNIKSLVEHQSNKGGREGQN